MNTEENLVPDKNDMIKKFIKYIIHSLVIFISLKFIISKKLDTKEMICVMIVISLSFFILDMYAPVINNIS